ncbi:hypothetical protein Tco_0879100 [Tanacetum coccineum]
MASTSLQARNVSTRNVSIAEFLTEFNALKNQVALIKKRKANEFDDLTNRFSKLQSSQAFLMFKRILQNNVCTKKEETNFNPKQSEEIPNFCSDHKDTSNHTAGVYTNPMPASSSSHAGKDDEVACHADDRMETDADHLVIRKLGQVDHFTDDYMLMLNDEEKPVKSSLADMELEQQPNNLVKADDKPNDAPVKVKKKKCQRALRPDYVLRSAERRKKKLGMALKPPYGKQSATILAPRKIRSKSMNTDVITPPLSRGLVLDRYVRTSKNTNLSRPDDCKRDKVTVLDYMSEFIKNKALLEYQFPWGKRDIFVGCRFWLTLACLDIGKTGWLTDHCLAELEIRNRVGTFYDSLGWASGNRRQCWRKMKRYFPEKVTLYLHMYGVLESKGISADSYNIIYNYADALFQATLFGDCRIWVCIFLYRLGRNLPLTVDDRLETALAYHERMLEYFWNHKIEIESIVSIVEVTKFKDVTRVYRPKNIIHDLKMELNIYVSYKRAWKGKHLASDSNHGCPVASFAQLPFYCYNLKMANENIVTHIETDDEGHFKMLFIGFGVASASNIENNITDSYSQTKRQTY